MSAAAVNLPDVAELERVRAWADALIALHLDPAEWSFGFDNAKRRAGLCDFSRRRISVSRHLARLAEDDDIHQVLLHEVAHALTGPGTGHGPRWRSTAREIGYVGSRLYDGPSSHDSAPWVGVCPRGHEHFRYRAPRHPLACGECARRFDPANRISWRRRDVRGGALRDPQDETRTSFQKAT